MWQLSSAIDGMAEACRALGLPVIGGNVSLYNESRGRDIDPSPVVGVVGMVDDLRRRPPGVGLVAGAELVVLGAEVRSLAGSRWAWDRGHRTGPPPALDLEAHGALCDVVRGLVATDRLVGVHDAADGLGVALAEMAVRSGIGFAAAVPGADHAWLFAESASRVVLATTEAGAVLAEAASAGVPAQRIGTAGGDRLVVEGLLDVPLADAVAAYRGRLPHALGAGSTH
jgi:phosphoribosylformylglycinamidine synthase